MSHELPEGVVAPPAPPSADDLAALIEESSPDQLGIFVRLLHPADLAEVFAETDPRLHWPKVIAASDDARLSGVLSELEGGAFDDLVLALPDARLARLVGVNPAEYLRAATLQGLRGERMLMPHELVEQQPAS